MRRTCSIRLIPTRTCKVFDFCVRWGTRGVFPLFLIAWIISVVVPADKLFRTEIVPL